MACDSLYAAWLKAHYPYEFYVTMLKLYTEKGNKEKVSLIIDEMRRYMNVRVMPGRFGEDNRDWLIDRVHKTVSLNLTSIKYISAYAANTLYKMSTTHYDTFVDLLNDVRLNTSINSRQIDVLIQLGYFQHFGSTKKLEKIADEFRNGKNKITPSLIPRTIASRMEVLRAMERETPDEPESIYARVAAEFEYMGRCFSSSANAKRHCYFVEEVDDAFGVKAAMYNPLTGGRGMMRFRKDVFNKNKFAVGQIVYAPNVDKVQKYRHINGEKIPIEGEYDFWSNKYEVYGKKETAV